MRHRILLMPLAAVLLSVLVVGAQADEVKERMLKRKPVVEQLKKAGVVGEDLRGYLSFVGAKRDKANVVAAENADRRLVYQDIARQLGTAPELVGKRRALQIFGRAPKGTYIQGKSGKWVKK